MKKENCYLTLTEACKCAAGILKEEQLLDDGANNWDIDNLMDAVADAEELDGDTDYYCVGTDGSIGITHDDGISVKWVYKAKWTSTPQERWQKRHGLISKSYKLQKDVVDEFAAACEAEGTTQAKQLTKMMKEFITKSIC